MKIMRRIFLLFIFFLLIGIFPLSIVMAQQPVGELESVQISFWPDFDDPSVLVLITGQLPEETPLPAQVSIPIPQNAQINAVASIDDAGMASIDFDTANGNITFLTTSPRFRVEYYAPYQQEGLSRSYDFEWVSELPVGELSMEVQQPTSAVTLSSEPAASNMYTSQVDGLFYHALEPIAVPAETPYQLSFDYEMSTDTLTAGQATAGPAVTTGQDIVAPLEDGNNNLLIFAGIAGLVALAVIGTWLIATRTKSRKSKRPVKPKPKTISNSNTGTAVVYCHNCGLAAESNDRFCRRCGTELKKT
jgi:hypothetical protein